MDTSKFDCLTKTVSATSSRRAGIAAMAGGLLAALGIRAEEALACSHKGQACVINRNCCAGMTCKIPEGETEGTCKYKGGCGEKNAWCKENRDCCGGFTCSHRRCVRK